LDKPIHADGYVEITSANGIWIKGGNDVILDSYVNLVEQVHDAQAQPLPLTYDPINSYIETKTKGMISNMMSGDIDPLTVAILVNAIHFKGLWRKSFDPKRTKEGSFHAMGKDRTGTVERKAMFMEAERHMDVALDVDELNGASMVRLDYGKSLEDGDARGPPRRMMPSSSSSSEEDAEFSAFFILPSKDDADGLNGVFHKLAELSRPTKKSSKSSPLPLDGILGDTFSEKIKLSLPRFRLSYGTQSISEQLQSMGIKDAFNGQHVFDAMSSDPDVHVSDVLHKAVMEVTEEGTVAAAATVGIMMTRSMPTPPKILRFDRPFGVLVVHRSKGDDGGGWTPLFMGRVDDPEFEF